MQQTAVVTGAASGLGYELMILLAKDNYDLVLIDIDEVKLFLHYYAYLNLYLLFQFYNCKNFVFRFE